MATGGVTVQLYTGHAGDCSSAGPDCAPWAVMVDDDGTVTRLSEYDSHHFWWE